MKSLSRLIDVLFMAMMVGTGMLYIGISFIERDSGSDAMAAMTISLIPFSFAWLVYRFSLKSKDKIREEKIDKIRKQIVIIQRTTKNPETLAKLNKQLKQAEG